MAEALVSAVLGQLVSIITELGKQELRLVKDVEKSVSNLKRELKAIQAVLEDAERKQLEDTGVRLWLNNLKDVSYDINDVLDDWISEILKSQIPNHVEEEEGDHHQKADLVSNKKMMMMMMKKKKEVCFPSPSCCFCLNQLKQVGVRHNIARRIKELNETLDEIAKGKHAYSLEKTNNASPKERRETTSFVYESDVDGRDEDMNHVISKLLSDESSDKVPVIIPIVGMGGIGKTTLAQLVFNHENIKTHFNERIWVCVSIPFDEVRISKAILESLKVNPTNLHTLQALSDHIVESVKGKKFLLVLDDVWSDEREKWEKLIHPLRSGAEGSRVLVTTRKNEVANMMGIPTSQIINLTLLSEDHCWKIIKRLAFRERNGDEFEQLEGVGKEIAKKCKGLPLVAKTLGGLMFSKETLKEWEDVLSSKLWELQDEQSKTFAPFFLSYNDLSPREKRCFSYCSVFPKDFEINRYDLIDMWMSQGYLSGSQDMEKEGEKCFKILTMRSFFQDFERDDDGSIESCKMHDILHDFSQFLTKNECSTMTVDMEEIGSLSAEKVRHLTLQTTPERGRAKFPTSIFRQNNLHTLSLNSVSGFRFDDHDNDMLSFLQTCCHQKHLRTLYLMSCGITKVPEQLGQLIHLRYLNLSHNYRLIELPDEVCDLFNLQTLKISYCSELQRLPKGMGKLLSLRHFYCSGCDNLKELPKGIGRLTKLRILDGMIIPENNEAYLSLGDLKRLNHLQTQTSFWIYNCHNLMSLGENSERVLMNWKCLVHLALRFRVSNDSDICEDEFGILETLQPHSGLKSLVIRLYNGSNLCSKWMMSLDHLKSLNFFACKHIETLPPLGSLPSLEELTVYALDKLRKIGVEFLGNNNESFPKLKLLVFISMGHWEEWEGNIETTDHTDDAAGGARPIIMPRLHSLHINTCPILKSLPEYLKPTPLKNLSIKGSNMLCQSLAQSEKEWLKISHIPNIDIDIDGSLVIRRDGKWNYDELARLGIPRAFVHNGNEEDPS